MSTIAAGYEAVSELELGWTGLFGDVVWDVWSGGLWGAEAGHFCARFMVGMDMGKRPSVTQRKEIRQVRRGLWKSG